jgi:dihydrodipicolinate synthase/N-acetylneuraminate lyase
VGIVPTPATGDAEQWQSRNTVNLAETAKMIDIVVDSGVDVVMTTGTFGECATLTTAELRDFVDCVVQTTAKRRPVFAGITTLNTRDTIERGRELLAYGADGLFVGRPMWLPLDDAGIVRFYRDIAEGFAGVPLVIYDNPFAFKGKISTDVYRELAKIPEFVASKHVGGPALKTDMAAVGDRLTILPLETDWYEIATEFPDRARACWSGAVACAPAPIVALAGRIAARDWEAAKQLSDDVNWAISAMIPDGDLAQFIAYSIQLGHERFAAAGLIDPGPCRPPYIDVPAHFVAGSRECGQRWKTLQAKYARTAAEAIA